MGTPWLRRSLQAAHCRRCHALQRRLRRPGKGLSFRCCAVQCKFSHQHVATRTTASQSFMVCALMQGHEVVMKTAAGTGKWGEAVKLLNGLPQGGVSSGDELASLTPVKLRLHEDMACPGFQLPVHRRQIHIRASSSWMVRSSTSAFPCKTVTCSRWGQAEAALSSAANHSKMAMGGTVQAAGAHTTVVGLNSNDRTETKQLVAMVPPGNLTAANKRDRRTAEFLGNETAHGNFNCGAPRSSSERYEKTKWTQRSSKRRSPH